MKRALLVTTGTVVGVASVLAYKPSTDALGNIPGVQTVGNLSPALATSGATANPAAATTPASTPSSAPASAAPSTPAATPAATATHKAAKKKVAKKKATHKAKKPVATHKATAKPKPTAAAAQPTQTTAASAPKPTATATPKPAPTQAATGFKDGTFTSSSQQVLSHGGYYGDLTANVTVSGGKITSINLNETGGGRNGMFAQAVQQYLVPEIIKTQNPRVGIVSGATGTSMALINALASVLQKA